MDKEMVTLAVERLDAYNRGGSQWGC